MCGCGPAAQKRSQAHKDLKPGKPQDKAKDELSDQLGSDINSWTWGKVHQIENTNPIRLSRSRFEKCSSVFSP